MTWTTFAERTNGRNNNFDFLRLLLATAVIASHSYAVLGYFSRPLTQFSHHQIDLGSLAVDGFFAISGLLITVSWLRNPALFDFFKKRVLRIYPGFILASLFGLLVVGPLGSASTAAYFHAIRPLEVAKSIIFLNRDEHFPPTMLSLPRHLVNASLWTIKSEFTCYMAVAFLGIIGFLRIRAGVPILFLILLLTPPSWLMHLGPLTNYVYFNELQRCFTYFFAGMTFWYFRDKIICSRPAFLFAVVMVLASMYLGGLKYILPICGTYVLMYVAYSPTIILHNFGRRADLSYGVYLYGWPVLQLLVLHLGMSTEPHLLFVMALAIACMFACVSWFLVERPCLKLKTTRILN
jgi:peptidoglycan/LPS O-acetylase OafA/YrhL